ncbi:hypothetical protein BC831DRAFT_283805, partial [Entophlyctis helioformis]
GVAVDTGNARRRGPKDVLPGVGQAGTQPAAVVRIAATGHDGCLEAAVGLSLAAGRRVSGLLRRRRAHGRILDERRDGLAVAAAHAAAQAADGRGRTLEGRVGEVRVAAGREVKDVGQAHERAVELDGLAVVARAAGPVAPDAGLHVAAAGGGRDEAVPLRGRQRRLAVGQAVDPRQQRGVDVEAVGPRAARRGAADGDALGRRRRRRRRGRFHRHQPVAAVASAAAVAPASSSSSVAR